MNNYYVLDTKEIIVHGPLTEEKFTEVKENAEVLKNITIKELDEYKKVI